MFNKNEKIYEDKEFNKKYKEVFNNYKPYTNLKYLNPFLYEITYDDIDYEFGKQYMKEELLDSGKCTAVRKGNFYGRNFDWYYDNEVSFVVHMNHTRNRYASIGVACSSRLTRDIVENHKDNDYYKVLPFLTVDGINEWGLVCNDNVIPIGDLGYVTGTNPSAKETMPDIMLVRFILDHFKTATEAVNYVKNNVNVYSTHYGNVNQGVHIMVADKDNTYIIEFINNECVVKEVSDKPYMTNFYLNVDGGIWTSDGHADYDKLTDYASGAERYNLIVDKYSSLSTLNDMKSLMKNDLKYTNAYTSVGTSDIWPSEFVHDYTPLIYGNLTIHDAKDLLDGITTEKTEKLSMLLNRVKELYENRNRFDNATWLTAHTSIFDIENKKLYITVQEGYTLPDINPIDGTETENVIENKEYEFEI